MGNHDSQVRVPVDDFAHGFGLIPRSFSSTQVERDDQVSLGSRFPDPLHFRAVESQIRINAGETGCLGHLKLENSEAEIVSHLAKCFPHGGVSRIKIRCSDKSVWPFLNGFVEVLVLVTVKRSL